MAWYYGFDGNTEDCEVGCEKANELSLTIEKLEKLEKHENHKLQYLRAEAGIDAAEAVKAGLKESKGIDD